MFFVAYSGSSMYPTLREPALLDVVPYDGRLPCVGDVVYFRTPPDGRPFVHRVIRVTPAGVSTRGDNNAQDDAFVLPSGSMQGRVVAAWRGQKRRQVAGGLAGRLLIPVLRCRRGVRCYGVRLLDSFGRILSRWGWIGRVLQAIFRPRVVCFRYGGEDSFQLLLRSRVVGRYDEQRCQWLIRQPYRLLVEKNILPMPPAMAGSAGTRCAGSPCHEAGTCF
jgi:hypothetical protein